MPLPLGPFPYILTNGTLADANQVMADFNLLLNGINGLAPLAQVVAGGTSNVAANLATAGTSITVTADTATVATALNGTAYTLTSFSQSFNGATTGPGGMDIGALPTSSYVALYAIYNPTAPAISILGKAAGVSAPTIYNGVNMPAGYTASALLCILPTNATPALTPGYVRNRTFEYGSVGIALNGSTLATVLTSLSLAAVVPPSAISVIGGYMSVTTTASVAVNNVNASFGSQSTGNPVYYISFYIPTAVAATYGGTFGSILLATPQTIFYSAGNISANATLAIAIAGYSW